MNHTTPKNVYTDHYLDLLKETRAHFYFSRTPQLQFSLISPLIEQALGYSADEFQANWEHFFTSNIHNVENLSRFKSPVIGDERNRYEFEIFHSLGRSIWIEIIEECVFNESNEVICLNSIAWDVTLQKNLEIGIKLREDRFREISECTPIGIFQVDPDDLYIYVNTRWQAITGQSLRNALGHPWWKIVHPLDQEELFQGWSQAENEGSELNKDCRINRPDGETRWVRLRTRFFFHDSGKMTVGTVEDITESRLNAEKLKLYAIELEEKNNEKDALINELHNLKDQLEVSAKTDPLTGLLNRRGMNEKIDQELIRYERSHNAPTFIITDIDHFKKFNDTYGHDIGDYILSEVSKDLRSSLRKQDILCRWGGEEFLFLLPETDLQGGALLAEKCRSRIENRVYSFKNLSLKATLSFGVCSYDPSVKSADTCIKRADECLYQAKKSGRNKVVSALTLSPH